MDEGCKHGKLDGHCQNEEESSIMTTHPENRLTLDTDTQVFFYEQDHYYLSNFSAFTLRWEGRIFPTSEHAYQWSKFPICTRGEGGIWLRDKIMNAPSAHEAFKLAERLTALRHPDWDDQKLSVMFRILRAKVDQHEYVRRKLLETGDRELIENSWRDDFWGWGPNRATGRTCSASCGWRYGRN